MSVNDNPEMFNWVAVKNPQLETTHEYLKKVSLKLVGEVRVFGVCGYDIWMVTYSIYQDYRDHGRLVADVGASNFDIGIVPSELLIAKTTPLARAAYEADEVEKKFPRMVEHDYCSKVVRLRRSSKSA